MAEKHSAPKINAEGLLHSLDNIKQDLSWIERVEIVADDVLDVEADDDLKRETAL